MCHHTKKHEGEKENSVLIMWEVMASYHDKVVRRDQKRMGVITDVMREALQLLDAAGLAEDEPRHHSQVPHRRRLPPTITVHCSGDGGAHGGEHNNVEQQRPGDPI